MKFASTVFGTFAVIFLPAQSVLAQEEPKPAVVVQTQPASRPAAKPPEAVNPKGVLEAEQLLLDASKAYRAATVMTDSLKAVFTSEMQGTQSQELTFAFDKGTNAKMCFPGMSFIAAGDQLYVVKDDVKDKYFATPLEGDIVKTLEKLFGEGGNMPPQFAFRASDVIGDYVHSLTMGMIPNAQIVNHELTKTADGVAVHEIRFEGDGGNGKAHLLPDSKFVTDVSMEMDPIGAPAGLHVSVAITMSPKTYDKLPEPITFEPGDRKKVDSIDQLEATPIAEGDAAPDFTLKTLEGETVTLSSLKGSVVILDFWATWCGPCKMALPLLQEFSKWAATSGKPIKIYAVDVWQREEGDDAKTAAVSKFWTDKGYTVPVLMDLDNKVVGNYGFRSIPTTLIIGADGKIKKVHSGYDKDMVENLKKEVAEDAKAGE